MDNSFDVPERLALKGVTRRDLRVLRGLMATILGLPLSMAPRVAHAVANKRPSDVWLHFAEI